MKYLLVLMLASYVPAWIFVRGMYAPGAEFDRALPALVSGVLAVALTLAYVAAVFWNHRFW